MGKLLLKLGSFASTRHDNIFLQLLAVEMKWPSFAPLGVIGIYCTSLLSFSVYEKH